jgi:molecular chaperone HtpG
MVEQVERHQFQAETKQLLDLMIHSLYTHKEIFLRELISNASDALDRLRFEALTAPELLGEDFEPRILLETDPEARTLTVSDNGIGMSRDEVVANIGTIARSGTRELRERMAEGASGETLAALIGQFGVGFYSSFMVADRVTLETRRAGEDAATRWESTGDGQYTLTAADKPGRGTSITLHLKAPDPESGVEDYTDRWVLARIVRRHSDFVSYPIVYRGERDELDSGPMGKQEAEADAPPVVEEKVLNSMKPIWNRPASEVTEEEYREFYKHISHELTEPMHYMTARAEGVFEYKALLFIPGRAPHDLYYHTSDTGLRLYAKGVLIMERCPDLLPHYLRFLKGVVDSADIPLNISRQMLQQDRQVAQIRKWLTKKTLDVLQGIFDSDNEKYLKFWAQFGRAFKEGVSSDYDSRERILPLVLFESSADPERLTTLKDYVGRMKEGQQEIFYLTGESRRVVENSPHLEAVREKGFEVLYLVDPVDELVVQTLTEYEGKRLKSVGKGAFNLADEGEASQQELREKQEQAADMLKAIQQHLDEYIKDVRLTSRLTTSPVCLVGSDLDYSPHMERLLMKGKGGGPRQRRIMELNPAHEIFLKFQKHYEAGEGARDALVGKYADLLLGYALLAEGSELPDPVRFNNSLAELMTQSL